MRTVLSLLFSCVLFLSGYTQDVETVLPYRLVGGKMIVDMKVNGQMRPFIFDTGGQTALTEEFCQELNLEEYDTREVTDANGDKSEYHRVLIRELFDPDMKIAFRDVPAIRIPAPSPFVCFQAEGLIGSDLLQYFVVEIDGRNKTIRLISKQRVALPSLRKMLPFAQAGFMPIVQLQAGAGNALQVLFDTGYSGFLSLKKSDFERMKGQHAFRIVDEGYGQGAIGLGGMAGVDTVFRVQFPEISIGASRYLNVLAETATPPFTLLGVKVLDYGKITLDYPHGRFYFEPYDDEARDLNEAYYQKVELTVREGDLVVATVWSAVKDEVSVGDKVSQINGKPVGKYDFCTSILSGIPELKKKKSNKLTLLTKAGERVIVYKKEKLHD